MIKQARNGRRLSDLEGVGLIELTLVLAGAVVLAAVLTGPVLCRLNTARAERTLADMSAILEAGRKYYDTFAEFQYLYRSGDVYSPKLEDSEPLRNVCVHFIDCIKSGKAPLSGGVSGLRVVKVVEAALESLRNSGKEIAVNEE